MNYCSEKVFQIFLIEIEDKEPFVFKTLSACNLELLCFERQDFTV
jgi:hypothetical protein